MKFLFLKIIFTSFLFFHCRLIMSMDPVPNYEILITVLYKSPDISFETINRWKQISKDNVAWFSKAIINNYCPLFYKDDYKTDIGTYILANVANNPDKTKNEKHAFFERFFKNEKKHFENKEECAANLYQKRLSNFNDIFVIPNQERQEDTPFYINYYNILSNDNGALYTCKVNCIDLFVSSNLFSIIMHRKSNSIHIDKIDKLMINNNIVQKLINCNKIFTLTTLFNIFPSNIISQSLTYAIQKNNLDLCQQLLEHGADPNMRDNQDKAPLHYAVNEGNIDICTLLLKHDAEPNIYDSSKRSPLYYASNEGNIDICTLLLKYSADPNIQDCYKDSPLKYAASKGNIDICRLLLEHGADPNIQDDIQRSPLHFAVNQGNIDICKLLLKYGSDPNIKNSYNKTPWDLANNKNLRRLLVNNDNNQYAFIKRILVLGFIIKLYIFFKTET